MLSVARALGSEIAFDRITPEAQAELDSVGCTSEWMHEKLNLSKEEIIARADELIPGVESAAKHKVSGSKASNSYVRLWSVFLAFTSIDFADCSLTNFSALYFSTQVACFAG